MGKPSSNDETTIRHQFDRFCQKVLHDEKVDYIMWSFQDFLFPLMFLTKDKAYTTTVAVNAFKGAYGMTPQNLGRYNAALVLISIPSILIFTFAQKFIVNGITSGAVKE